MENAARKTPSLVETEEECIKKTTSAVPTTSASTADGVERTRDKISTPVETEEDYLKQTLAEEPTTSLPVEVGMQTTTDGVPSSADTEEECFSTSFPGSFFSASIVVSQRQLYRVCFFLFALQFRSNQTEWKRYKLTLLY